jgi:uncharacterized membrane protein YkvA (DUF1232 family)
MILTLVALVSLWASVGLVAWLLKPDDLSVVQALSLMPDTLRLLYRLAGDRSLSRGCRVAVWGAGFYIAAAPVNIIPDFIPVLGCADDIVVVLLALRFVAARGGRERLAMHWPGSPQGLAILMRGLGSAGLGASARDGEGQLTASGACTARDRCKGQPQAEL